MTIPSALLWGGFVLLVLLLLALDLGVFNRRAREISIPEALGWTAFWIFLSLAFNVLVYWFYEHNWIGAGLAFPLDISGRQAAIEFLTGYLLEKSLSLDNIFVFALIFAYFRVPLIYQHRVLFWGVLGALMLRGVMIAGGAALLHGFAWMTYVFGTLLLLTAARMLVVRHDNLAPEENFVVRIARRWIPLTPGFADGRFFTTRNGVRTASTLFLVLVMVETTDIMFAVDSIPAIFAVTRDPFIVYTSNVFAILGLRSLYFALAPMLERFRYLKASLVFVLAFVGFKMLLSHTRPIPALTSLAVVAGILAVGLVASLVGAGRGTAPLRGPVEPGQLAITTTPRARRAIGLVIGGTALALGTAMIFMPGPELLVIPLGLVILASQFLWARRLVRGVSRQLQEGMEQMRDDARARREQKREDGVSGDGLD
jgi:tellurite resistance protein TerC